MAVSTTDPAVDEQIYTIRTALARHRRLQTYNLTMLRDSAVLAAFQTVDVRLTSLERKGQEPTTLSSLLLEAAMVACFSFTGSLVLRGLTAVFNSILKSRLAFAIVPKSPLGLWVKDQFHRDWDNRIGQYRKQLKDRYKIIREAGERTNRYDDYRKLLADEEAELKLFQKGFLDHYDVRGLYHEFTFKAVDPLIQSASNIEGVTAKLKGFLSRPAGPLNAMDSPTVQVLRSALEFFNRQIETQHLVLDEFDLALAGGHYTEEELEKLALILLPGSEVSFESIALNLDVWIRFFEFCIWVTLFPDIGGRIEGLASGDPKLKGVPAQLQDYLLRRLFAEYKNEPAVGTPFTILENAVFEVMPQAERIRDFHTLRGRPQHSNDRSYEKAVERAKPQAVQNLGDLWRELSANMAQATQKLYASARTEGG